MQRRQEMNKHQNMQIAQLLLFFSQFTIDDCHRERRDVRSISNQNLNRHIKTYEIGESIVFDTPNLTLIDSLLKLNGSTTSVRAHTSWLMRQIPSSAIQSIQRTEIARYNPLAKRFILNHTGNLSLNINSTSGQLTMFNITEKNIIHTEISIRVQSGLDTGDDLLHDTYRLVHIPSEAINCTRNLTLDVNKSIDINCTISYEYVKYDGSDEYRPTIDLTFYIKHNDSMYSSIDLTSLKEIKDLQTDNRTFNWQRSIRYTIEPINPNENHREYICALIPDTLRTSKNIKQLFESKNRVCQTVINVRNNNVSTAMSPRSSISDGWNLVNMLTSIIIGLTVLLLLGTLAFCLVARRYRHKRSVQIKPEIPNNTSSSPAILSPIKVDLHRHIIPADIQFINDRTMQNLSNHYPNIQTTKHSSINSHRHKPGCPKYVPLSEYNLLSNEFILHNNPDTIQKIILPDIPQNDEETNNNFIHFYRNHPAV